MLEFACTYAGVPFVLDTAKVVRLPGHAKPQETGPGDQSAPGKYQPLADLLDELNKKIDFRYLQDFGLPANYLGRTLGAIAQRSQTGPYPNPSIPPGTWYYPTGASRWGVFRGLATSSMAKEMLERTMLAGFPGPYPFIMAANPLGPNNPGDDAEFFALETPMYLLPPRPLAEHGGDFDGLYLITLVDERYWWQYSSISLGGPFASWIDLVDVLAASLGVTLNMDPDALEPLAAYQSPEPDSQFWTNLESAAALLDAVAYNIGCVVVRGLDGTYTLMRPETSKLVAEENRLVTGTIARTAGGDIFQSGGTQLPIGDLTQAKQLVLPGSVSVTFPMYVIGDDPVPHYFNPRYANPRPTSWFEESYGDVYAISVPISSGGPDVAGMLGNIQWNHTIHSTAKALLETEADAVGEIRVSEVAGEGNDIITTTPLVQNELGLRNLAVQLAVDYYSNQVGQALDEVYPGIVPVTPEGFHDIIWTYSARSRQATTRVLRTQWNQMVTEMQHATPAPPGFAAPQYREVEGPLSGQLIGDPATYVPPGMGGKAVAQTIRDSYDVDFETSLNQTLHSGDQTASFATVDYFPTQNRWKGQIDDEIMLFEGTSGGLALNRDGATFNKGVDVVYRAIDGTLRAQHANGATVTQVLGDTTYGVNLTTYEKAHFAYPAEWTSGGIQGVNIVSQTQTVYTFTSSPASINQIDHYSGKVATYDPTRSSGAQFIRQELAWVVERNGNPLHSGEYFNGQLMGYSASGPVAPVYAVDSMPGSTVIIQPGDTPSGSQPGIPTYVSGRLTTLPCNFSPVLKAGGPPYPANIVAQMRNVFGLDFLGSSGYQDSPGLQFDTTGNFGQGSCTSGAPKPGGSLPNPISLGNTFYSTTPGISFNTLYSQGQGDTGTTCTIRILPNISYPPPNSTTFVNGYTYGAGKAMPLNFVDTCTNKWDVRVNVPCGTLDLSVNWQGLAVGGADAQGGEVDASDVDSLSFSFEDFIVSNEDEELPGAPPLAGKCVPLTGVLVSTKGYSGGFTVVYSVSFDPSTCVLTVSMQTIQVRDGLIQKGTYY